MQVSREEQAAVIREAGTFCHEILILAVTNLKLIR